jgi:hypothetical protein
MLGSPLTAPFRSLLHKDERLQHLADRLPAGLKRDFGYPPGDSCDIPIDSNRCVSPFACSGHPPLDLRGWPPCASPREQSDCDRAAASRLQGYLWSARVGTPGVGPDQRAKHQGPAKPAPTRRSEELVRRPVGPKKEKGEKCWATLSPRDTLADFTDLLSSN